jgi:hypothetical protein
MGDKYSARTCWVGQDGSAAAEKVVVDDGRIAFDVEYNGYEYTVALAPAAAGPPWWKGTWKCGRESGHVDARLYKGSDGGMCLVGHWKEDGQQYYWLTELRP